MALLKNSQVWNLFLAMILRPHLLTKNTKGEQSHDLRDCIRWQQEWCFSLTFNLLVPLPQ